MKKILITGGAGFMGHNLVKRINRRYKLKILAKENAGKEDILGDLMSYDFIDEINEKFDVLIHLAFSKNYPENIVITQNMIKLAKKVGAKKIILLSSMSAKRTYPDAYGKIKIEIEKLVKNSGIDYTILRPSIVYGRGSTSFNFIIENMRKVPLITPVIGSGKYKISPVHLEDVLASIESCINNENTDRKEYDLPGGEAIYFLSLINVLKRELKIKKINFHVPIFLCDIVTIFFPGLISRENIKNLTEDSIADISKAKKDFGYNPIKFSDGVKNGLL